MGFTTPRDWSTGEIVTEAMMDVHVKDNLRFLRGLDGVVTLDSGLIIDNTGGDEYVKLPLLSTAETGTVLTSEGQIAHDEQTHRIKLHDGTAVRSLVSTIDVDDTPVNGATTDPVSSNWAYDFINTLTTQADLPYATAAGVWTRLPKGTTLQLLRMNAGATAPEWWTSSGAVISKGTYSGDSSANKAIAHSLGVTPKLVMLANTDGGVNFMELYGMDYVYCFGTTFIRHGVTAADGTNFYVGNATNYSQSANISGKSYEWTAIG